MFELLRFDRFLGRWRYHLSLACLYRFPNRKKGKPSNALLQPPVFINSVARRFLKLIASQKGPMNGRVKSFDVVFYHEGIESICYLCLHPRVVSRKEDFELLSFFWDTHVCNRQKVLFLNKHCYKLNLGLLLIRLMEEILHQLIW